jgi:hypothetical protein
MCGSAFRDEDVALAIVEVVIGQNQIVAACRKRDASGCQARHNGNVMRCQELPRDVLCKDCMVLQIENGMPLPVQAG